MKLLQFGLNIFYFGCFAILSIFSAEKFLIGRTLTELRFDFIWRCSINQEFWKGGKAKVNRFLKEGTLIAHANYIINYNVIFGSCKFLNFGF